MNDDRLDQRLRAAFSAPPAEQFADLAAHAIRGTAPSQRTRPLWPWLLAAAALLALTFLWLDGPRRGPQGQDAAQLGRLWAAAYADAHASGFSSSCCDAQFDLPTRCRERLGAALELVDAAGVDVIGCYCTGPDGGTMILLTQQGDQHGCICVLPRRNDPGVELPAGSDLQVARRELGPLVLYAIGPRADAAQLRAFELAGS